MKRLLIFLLFAVPLVAQQVQPGPSVMRPRQPGESGMMRQREGGEPGMMRGRMMGPGPGMDGKWWINTELAQKLNLNDAQIKQLETIFQQHRLQLIDQVATVQKAEVTLQPMLEADRPDESQVLAQIDRVAQARAELEKSNARMLLGMRQVLNLEQWKQLKSLQQTMGMRRFRTVPDGPGDSGMRMRTDGPQMPTPPPDPPEE